MANNLNFRGTIKELNYQTFLDEPLTRINLEDFDVNLVNPYGIIKSPKTEIAYSKWVSPKRTRSYPFARIYNTYTSSKVLTIIPVIKDEGKDGDKDRIQYSTISWMNLLNIYIVLAYYESAEKSNKVGQLAENKLTNQKFNSDFVNFQIKEIFAYHQSALHWNKNLFDNRFITIYQQALDCYDDIARKTGVAVHSRSQDNEYLQEIVKDFDLFKDISLKGSQNASKREAETLHKLEYLTGSTKAIYEISNYLGGIYFLTSDEVFYNQNNNIYSIQECKNTSGNSLPNVDDIKDGLFKLILFSNLDSLILGGKKVDFTTRLKLTGKNVIGSLLLPTSNNEIEAFLSDNEVIFSRRQKEVIKKLALEASENNKLSIEISSNNKNDTLENGLIYPSDQPQAIQKKVKPLLLSLDNTNKVIKSPLRYPGGKSKAINKILQYLPSNFYEYREPFVGGGSLFIYLKQQNPQLKIWINDLNQELFLFWKYAQSSVDELVDEVQRIKDNYQDGRRLFEELTQVNITELSEFKRAVRFFVLNRITFSGTAESGGFSQQSFLKRFTNSSIKRLKAVGEVLENVKITNLDYSEVLQTEGDQVFSFLDPPYLTATNSRLYGQDGNLHTSFNHQRFAEVLNNCPHQWLITYDDSLEIRKNFEFANIASWELQYSMNNYKQNNAAKGKELFITNYEVKLNPQPMPIQLTIDYSC